MKGITLIFIVTVLIEGLIQVFKAFIPENTEVPTYVWPAVSLGLGVLFCILGGIDIVREAGLSLSVPLVGSIITGILISRGSNFLHDLWQKLKNGFGDIIFEQIPEEDIK
ncbi:MAG: hypothetical protein GX786_02680 [Clostridiales bacterium]|nr:hypothetical protein [Clostridiales bacterium]